MSEIKEQEEPKMWYNGFKSGTDFNRDRTYTVLASKKKKSSLTWTSGLGGVDLTPYRHMSTAM